jgi:antirestriction protein
MNYCIISFSTPQQAHIISTQYLRDEHLLYDDSILISSRGLDAVHLAARLESFDFDSVPNCCPIISPSQHISMLQERECRDNDTPKIYVACLAAYNSGFLHGLWIDATQDPEAIQEDITFMLSLSPVSHLETCDEWAIHAFEGFEGISLDEYESIDRVSALAQAIAEHGKPFSLYVDYLGFDDIEQALNDFQDNYYGCFKSAEDYAYNFFEETGQLKTIEQAGLNSFYIDWAKIARDWEYSGDLLFLEDSYDMIHVFSNH